MAISGIHNHFVLPTDQRYQTSAVSSNFKPALLGNKAAAFFKQQKNPTIQNLGQALERLRSADLKFRAGMNEFGAKAQKFATKSSALMETVLRSQVDPVAIKEKLDAKLKKIDLKAEIKNERLKLKQEINQAISKEDLETRVADSNAKLQDFLKRIGYVPVAKRLSEHPLPKHNTEYVSNAQGHKVRINEGKPSIFQKGVSAATSFIHDHRLKGATKLGANTAVYGAVGLSNALHLLKQGASAGLAKIASKGSEERMNAFLRYADKARDMRRLNNAALGGNAKLADIFDKISNARKESFDQTLSNQGYTKTQKAMPGTSYTTRTTRKINDYLSQEAPNPQMARIAEFLVSVKNPKESVKAEFHGSVAKATSSVLNTDWISKKFTANKKETVQGFINNLERRRFDAIFRKSTNSAVLKGNLQQEVKNGTVANVRRTLSSNNAVKQRPDQVFQGNGKQKKTGSVSWEQRTRVTQPIEDATTKYFAEHTKALDEWLETNNYQRITNPGTGNNCLILSLLQHAKGKMSYSKIEMMALSDKAEEIRKKLGVGHDGMLFAFPGSNDASLQKLVNLIKQESAAAFPKAAKLNPFIVQPHESGLPYTGLDTHITEDELQDLDNRQVIVYGRHGLEHYEAMMKKTA